MTIQKFVKNLNRLRTEKTKTKHLRMPITNEIIDDVVMVGGAMSEWDQEERNGRVYLTRRS